MFLDFTFGLVRKIIGTAAFLLIIAQSFVYSLDSLADPIWTDVSGIYRSSQGTGLEGSLLVKATDFDESDWSLFIGPVIGGSSISEVYVEAEIALPYMESATGAIAILAPTYSIGFYRDTNVSRGLQQTISISAFYFNVPAVIPLPTIFYRTRKANKSSSDASNQTEVGIMIKIPVNYILNG